MIIQTVHWVARVSALVSVSFLLFMIGGHLFGSEPSVAPTHAEMVMLFFFPSSVVVGLVIALKWDGLGGFITLLGITGFHICAFIQNGDPDFVPLIDALAAPGLLFVIHWFLVRSRRGAYAG